jgi:hypothetical protein
VQKEKEAEGAPAASGKATAKAPKTKEPKMKYVFSESPLPFDRLKGQEVKLHVVAAEVAFEPGLLKDVDATVTVDGGRWCSRGAPRAATKAPSVAP